MSGEHRHGGPSCRDMLERLSDYIDGELPTDLCARIEGHMEDCPPCQAFLESLKRTVRLVEATPTADLPPDLRETLLSAARRLAD